MTPAIDISALVWTPSADCYHNFVESLFSLCRLLIKWKRAELRHRARLARNKQD
ncbi:hypothetical protein CK203_054025 [Vitis vinifera]|uniref:Uncharacterized protein n=1 Tax=Vitis vinifera TaxID=29760 RepID=A0A438GUI4_VITVI|nr:hypothetical protein CK203_054025 [Vitis vinifera]